MALQVHKVQVWSAEINDRAGAAAAKLELLARAGADLEFIFTRPQAHPADTSRLFVAPIRGPEQIQAARDAGLAPALDIAMLCVEGENRSGIAYDLMSQLAIAGINLRGLSISSVGHQFAAYLAFENADTAAQAIRVLAALM
jgi:hypothetical protein